MRALREPSVSCVIPARDAGAFLGEAIDSVLEQDYSAGRVEIVVVDDGSVDATPEILDGYGDRVRRVRHDGPRGVNAAVESGLAACTGDLITRLDADDAYTPDRLRVLTQTLAAHPDAGLAYSDMMLVDARGAMVAPSFNRAVGIAPVSGHVLGRLIESNFISAGAMMFRAELLERILPFPAHASVHDWWIALQAAWARPVVAVPESLYRYRRHGTNLNLGRAGRARLPLMQRELPLRRWLLGTIEVDEVGVEALWRALRAFDAQLAGVAELAEQPAGSIVDAEPDDRAAWLAAMAEASDALDHGDLRVAMGRLVRAAAADPADRQSRELVSQLVPHLGVAAVAA